MENELLYTEDTIKSKILNIRGQQVMIDRDLAELYGVETKRLNEQVKRNIERFPSEFCFQLTATEKAELVANCDRFNPLKHSTTEPYAFTEHGVTMLAAVLKSETAVKASIQIVKAFVAMRHFLASNAQKFNAQYPTLTVKHTRKMHDRFLIIDKTILYHIGASLKDLGKKCFAFEILDSALISAILQNV